MNQTNLFEIINRDALSFQYRLLAIEGLPLPRDDHERNLHERNLNILRQEIGYELQQPVVLTTFEGNAAWLCLPTPPCLNSNVS